MNTAAHQAPARILKRADVSSGIAVPETPGIAISSAAADRVPAPIPHRVTKEARLLPGASGTAAVEVRCSCGEWTRIELRLGDGKPAEEQR